VSAGVLLAVLLGAFLHASWNVLVKAGHDTSVAVAGVYIGAGILSAIALPFLPAPSAASWPYLAASTVVEVLYAVLLAAAYGLGVRASRAPVAYSLWLSLLVGLPWLVWVVMRRDYRWADVRRQLPAVALGGACSVGSYTLALWAMTRAPVAAVAAVRETSIVF